MEDWELLVAWRDGDQGAGKTLVSRYLGMLTRFFHNKVSDSDVAADLISETLLACTSGKERLQNPKRFRSFLFATAMNQLRRHYRRKTKRSRELDDFADVCVGDNDAPGSLSSRIARQRETRLMVRALRRLSMDQQIVLELHFLEDLNAKEIAELLEIPAPTVYTRLRRGRERLRVIMTDLAEDTGVVETTMMGLNTWAGKIREQLDEE